MKQSLSFIRTIHKVPSNIPSDSNELLIRAGYIHLNNTQFISYLPLAKRVLQKIEKIIREEMKKIQGNEVALPVLNSLNKIRSSRKSDIVNMELFKILNRNNEDLYLATTHEEILTSFVKDEINSYKQLPFMLYQIQTKFRDEVNHNGVFKSSEFLMMEAYSFHQSVENLNEFYETMENVYSSIFSRLGLVYKKVEADLGNYRGEVSHEFIILSENGDVTIAHSNESNVAVNIDLAQVIEQPTLKSCEPNELMKQKINDTSISYDEFLNSLDIPTNQMIKTKSYRVNEELIVVLYRGDHTLNEIKLKNVLNLQNLQLADDDFIRDIIGCSIHSVGPIKLPVNVKVIADYGIKSICNGLSFGNEDGYYYMNVNPERDFAINAYEDLRYIQENDPSPDGMGTVQLSKGYEVAHIFKLGSTYAEEWNATFNDENGNSMPLLMGAYGLGVSRLFAVAAEFYQDEKGFSWPISLTPFDVHLLTESVENEEQWMLSEQLHNILTTYQFEVLFDDRDTSIDVKLKDSNLIGIPIRVIVGKKANDGVVEVQYRRTGESFECAKEVLIDHLNEFFRVY